MKRNVMLAGLLSVAALAGCAGSEGGADGTLRLSVADSPVDEASSVTVRFSGIEIQPGIGDRIDAPFPARDIDLLKLSGGNSEALLPDLVLPAGHYDWVRLKVDAGPGVAGSFISVNGDTRDLRVPSGAESGLKIIRGFDVPAGGTADFTIDFDLRKSIHLSNQGYMLRPTLRMVDNTQAGSVSGTVDAALFAGPSCTGGNAVYVYSGTGVTPDDVGGVGAQPVTTAAVELQPGGNYVYKAAFLEAGAYTVAFTCQAASDDPAAADAVVFVGTAPVTVAAHVDTVHDF